MRRIWKRLAAVLLVLPLLAAQVVWASSEEESTYLSAFRQNGFLYVFASLESWPKDLSAEMQMDNIFSFQAKSAEKLSESGLPVTWLLMVDSSTSMEGWRGAVEKLTSKLAQADQTGARFLLATFGEEFSVVEESGSVDDVCKAASTLDYAAQRSDIAQGISDAAKYLSSASRQEGELMNLLVITDGVPYGDGQADLEKVKISLAGDPSILVHVAGLQSGGADSLLEELGDLGRGVHTTLRSSRGASSAASKLAGSVNDLCVLRFDWDPVNDVTGRIVLRDGSKDLLSLPLDTASIPVLSSVQAQTKGDGGTDGPESEQENPPEGTRDEPATGGSDSGNAPSGGGSQDPGHSGGSRQDNELNGSNKPGDSPSQDGGLPDSDMDGSNGQKRSGVSAWGIAIGVVLLLAAAGLVREILKQRKKIPPKGAVYMRLEVVSGSYAGGDGPLYLVDELIVGRDGQCDISWNDEEVSRRNSRIFLRDNVVYIEDLGSRYGTALGGMRLHEPNRLRSGDVISIGPVQFCLKF